MGRKVITDLVGNGVSKIIDFLVSGTPTVEAQIGFDTTDKRLTLHDGTEVTKIANLTDIIKAEDFQGEIAVAFPTDSDVTKGEAYIQAGDQWVFNASGDLGTAPKFGNQVVEAGDVIRALVDNASVATDFGIVQNNVDLTSALKTEKVTLDLTADTEATVTLSETPVSIGAVTVTDSAGERILLDETITDTSVKLTSNADIAGVIVKVVYNV